MTAHIEDITPIGDAGLSNRTLVFLLNNTVTLSLPPMPVPPKGWMRWGDGEHGLRGRQEAAWLRAVSVGHLRRVDAATLYTAVRKAHGAGATTRKELEVLIWGSSEAADRARSAQSETAKSDQLAAKLSALARELRVQSLALGAAASFSDETWAAIARAAYSLGARAPKKGPTP